MTKIMKFQYIAAAAVLLAGFATSCNDDDAYFESDAQGTPMKISKVYLEDYKSSVPDREVEFARLGQMLRLEGSGFYGVKKVYINGYDTYFNRAYVSDGSMIVSINSKTPVSDCDESVRNTIRLVKDGDNEFVYNFLIRNGYSIIENVSNTLPQPGETVTVTGSYLHETSKVILPGGVEVTEGIVNDEDGEWFTFVMPSGVTEGGPIISESPNGSTQSPAYFNERRGLLIDFDTEGQQGMWGGKDDDGNIKPGASMIYTEDLVDDPAGSGRGKCAPLIPQRLFDEGGIAAGKPRAAEMQTVGDGDKAWEDWSRMTDFIPAETPVNEIALQVDVYCPNPWTIDLGGQIQVQLINNYNIAGIGSDDDGKNNLVYCFAPYLSGGKSGEAVPFVTTGWQTLTIPMSSINKYATLLADAEAQTPTFQMVIDDRNAATYPNFGVGFVNSDFDYTDATGEKVTLKSSVFTGPALYFDNWRVVPFKAYTPSDYEEPEDEE